MIFSPLYFSQFRVETGCFSCKAVSILQSTIITMQALPLFQLPYRHRTALPETGSPPMAIIGIINTLREFFFSFFLTLFMTFFAMMPHFACGPHHLSPQRLVDNNDVWLSSPEKEISLFPLNYISLYHDLDQKF